MLYIFNQTSLRVLHLYGFYSSDNENAFDSHIDFPYFKQIPALVLVSLIFVIYLAKVIFVLFFIFVGLFCTIVPHTPSIFSLEFE